MGNQEIESRGTTGIPRRTLVKGAAWSIPVIAAAVAVPLAAASGPVTPACPVLTNTGLWITDSPTTGGFSPFTSGANGWMAPDGGPNGYGYFSETDGGSFGFGTTYQVHTSFVADPGTTYTFAYSVAGKHAPSTQSTSAQVLRIRVTNGGSTVTTATYSTNGAYGTQLPMWSGTASVSPLSGSFSIGPGLSGPVEIAYQFDLRPMKSTGVPWTKDGQYANDDIWVSAPCVVCS